LSDVYAMGGRPVTALSIVAYPGNGDLDVLGEILRGGMAKMGEAGCPVVGGHSVNDPEVKFGYAVTGVVHPAKVWTNAGARAGDVLFLTKPIGTGVIATAAKRGIARAEWMEEATAGMLRLNREAAEALLGRRVHGCTDITGFGLIGHGREMALGAGVTLEIEAARVPVLSGAIESVRLGAVPGGLKNNRDFAGCDVEMASGVDEDVAVLLYDPQTSGGLLVSMAEEDAADGVAGAVVIGRVTERQEKAIRIV